MYPFESPSMEPWDHDDPWDPGYGPDGHYPWSVETLDRLTHLVLVDGRLVDMWSEPVEGTRWQRHADRFDRERRPVVPAAPVPRRPPYDVVLDWLDLVAGGRHNLEGLSTEPLAEEEARLPLDTLDLRSRHLLESATAVLERAADEFPDPEMAVVLRRALRVLWDAEPEAVLRARSAAHTAAGVCWAVGKANGVFGPQGSLTQARLKEALELPCALSSAGSTVRRALQGLQPDERAPTQAPDLLPLGHPELLTSSTRRMLVRLRDRALEAKQAHEPDQLLP